MRALVLLLAACASGCLDFSVLEDRTGDLAVGGDDGGGEDLATQDLVSADLTGVDLMALPPTIMRVGASATSVQTTANLGVQAPAGMQAGDLVLLETWWDDPTKTITPPSGFTELATFTQPGSMVNKWYWHTAGGSESSYVLSWTGTVDCGALAVAYRGATGVVSGAGPSQLTSPFVIPSATTPQPNMMLVPLVTFFQTSSAIIDWTAPQDLTLVKSGGGVAAFERWVPSPMMVSFGSPTSNPSVNTIWVDVAMLSSQ